MRSLELGEPGPLRDRLVEAVLAGVKVATSSLLSDYEEAGEALPRAGETQLLVDSAGRDVATVEIVSVETIRLGDADLGLAADEGEGFGSVEEWRAAHEAFWAYAGPLDDDTRVVVERFRVVSRR